MKLNAIFFAASLLGLAATTDNNPNESPLSALEDIEAKLDGVIDNSASVSTRQLDVCVGNCVLPLSKCLDDCTDSADWCLWKCNCELFRDPNGFCRVHHCINLPSGYCTDVKRDTTSGPNKTPASVFKDHNFGEPDQCHLNCHLPWKQCVEECTDPNTSSCEQKCNCKLFSDPKQLCRVRNCVEAPNNCPDIKRDTTHVVDDFQAEVARAATVAPNPCISCKLAIDDCRKVCATSGACDEACRCKMKHSMWQCNECKIPCDCGHACPRGSLAARAKEMLDVEMAF